MMYQGDMVVGSNGCKNTRIYALAGRENRIFLFETSDNSERALRTFYKFRAFC
jgi:hypothetical protein